MNVLNKMILKKLRLNKVRTLTTLIGIILSTCLITSAVGIASSVYKTLIINSYKDYGYYHVKYEDLNSEQRKKVLDSENISLYYETNTLGYSDLKSPKKNKKYIRVVEYDKKTFDYLNTKLISGRLPNSNNEIVIQKKMNNSSLSKNIGDVITLDIGNIDYDNEQLVNTISHHYTIVGIIEDLDEYDDYYSAITYNDNIKNGNEIYVVYNKPSEVLNYICPIVATKEDSYRCIMNAKFEPEINYDLNILSLMYYGVGLDSEEKAIFIIISLGIILTLIVSCILIIKNSFEISVNERNKEYGVLASIGATSKQLKNSVIFEGVIESIICIPLGIILGIGVVSGLVYISNNFIKDNNILKLYFDIPIIAIVIIIIVSFITILLSCLIPAKKVSKITPLEAIRSNKDIKIKRSKTSKLISKIFGIGGVIADKNIKRNNKKYKNIIESITISLVLFIIITTSLNLSIKK